MKKTISTTIALLALLTGCSASDAVPETATKTTVTVTEPPVTITEAAPEEEYLEENMDEFVSSPEMQRVALEVTWQDMTLQDQEDICLGWSFTELRPELLDQFMISSQGMFDREVVEDYFNSVCP